MKEKFITRKNVSWQGFANNTIFHFSDLGKKIAEIGQTMSNLEFCLKLQSWSKNKFDIYHFQLDNGEDFYTCFYKQNDEKMLFINNNGIQSFCDLKTFFKIKNIGISNFNFSVVRNNVKKTHLDLPDFSKDFFDFNQSHRYSLKAIKNNADMIKGNNKIQEDDSDISLC